MESVVLGGWLLDSPADTCVQRLEAARERYDKFYQRVRSVITWVESSREKAAELDSMAKRATWLAFRPQGQY